MQIIILEEGVLKPFKKGIQLLSLTISALVSLEIIVGVSGVAKSSSLPKFRLTLPS